MTDKKTEALKLELQRIRNIVGQVTGLEDYDEENLSDAYKSICRVIDSLAEQPAQQQAGDSKTGESETQSDLKFAGETQAQQQEPVAEVRLLRTGGNAGLATQIVQIVEGYYPAGTKLYTSPPASKPWAGLTQEDMYEIGEFKNTHGYVPTGFKRLVAAIEAKLREKNA